MGLKLFLILLLILKKTVFILCGRISYSIIDQIPLLLWDKEWDLAVSYLGISLVSSRPKAADCQD